MTQKSVLTLIAPFIAASSIGVVLPSNAATFANFSQIELDISNLSLLPQDVGIGNDVKASLIVEVGEVGIQLDGDAIFSSDDSIPRAFGSTFIQTSISGTGVKYLGHTEVRSNHIGHFLVPANTTFSFDIQTSILLTNWTENPEFSPVSTSGNIQLILQDVLHQEDWPIFDFLGFLNTNSIKELSGDLFAFNPSSNLKIHEYKKQTLFGGNYEALEFSLTASFQKSVNEPTELVLLATTRSCNYSSNLVDVCVSVPEPSNRLGLIFGLLWLSYLFFFSRIINYIVKLTS